VSIFRSFSLFMAALCCFGELVASATGALPELRDKQYSPRNLTGQEMAAQLVLFADDNPEVLKRLICSSTPSDRRALDGRVADTKLRWELRLLYAVALAVQQDPVGRRFLADQVEKADLGRLAEVFWAINCVWRSGRSGEGMPSKSADMSWAEELMLKALKDDRPCHPRYLHPIDEHSVALVSQLAIEHGQFHEILVEQKSKKAVEALCDFIRSELRRPPMGGILLPIHVDHADQVAQLLFTLDDPSIEPVAIELARQMAKPKADYQMLRCALSWLVKRKNDAAIPIAVAGLRTKEGWDGGADEAVFCAMVGTKYRPYLSAIRPLLPEFRDGDAKGYDLRRQRFARTRTELILIMGEERDPVPKLMTFASDTRNEHRDLAINLLMRYKDPRTVVWAANLAASEKDWYIPFRLINLLETTPGDAAAAALISLLDCPFDKIVREENIHYTADNYRESVGKALAVQTGYKLPPNTTAEQWREWLKKRDAEGKRIVPLRRAIEKRFGRPDRSYHDGDYLDYDLPTGDILTFILDGEKLFGTVTTRRIDLKSLVGKRATLVGMLGMDIDGDAIFLPDGQSVLLGDVNDLNADRNAPSDGFASVTGVVKRGPWGCCLTGKLEIKILYEAGSTKASPAK
jgi:hypothetical protein